MRPRSSALAALLLAPLALSACGGGDEKAATPTPSAGQLAATASPARVRYAAAAEAVCSRAVAAGRLTPDVTTPAQYVTSFKATLAIGKEGLTGLQALTPPPEDLDNLTKAFLAPVAQQVKNFRDALPRIEAAAASADPKAELAKIADPGASVTVNLDYIEKYGMPSCALFAGKR